MLEPVISYDPHVALHVRRSVMKISIHVMYIDALLGLMPSKVITQVIVTVSDHKSTGHNGPSGP